MALVAANLANAIVANTTTPNFPVGYPEAGQAWADAYSDSYAASALSPMGGAPVTLAAAKATLAAALAVAFAAGFVAATTANAMAAAFVAFWLTPPIVFAGGPPGPVTATPGGAALGPALLSVFASNISGSLSAQASANAIAAVIDTFTKTVIVTHPVIPTPVVGPIT